MSSGARYLLPGRVLIGDLPLPGSTAILAPMGTVLTPDTIAKIRQAGLEEEAQKRVATRRQALDKGIALKLPERKFKLRPKETVQHRTRMVLEAVSGLRTVLYFLLAASSLFAAVSMSWPFTVVSLAVFGGLVASYLSTSVMAALYKKEMAEIARREDEEQFAQADFLRRLATGDEAAIATAILASVICKEDIVNLDIEKGQVVLEALLPDTQALVRRTGGKLEPRPLIRDPSRVGSLRPARSADLDFVLDSLAELVQGVFAASPTTLTAVVSLLDGFRDPETGKVFLGCIASIAIERYAVNMLGREADFSLIIGRLPELRLNYDRDDAFQEALPASLVAEANHDPHAAAGASGPASS